MDGRHPVDLSRCGLASCQARLPISTRGERVIFGFTVECTRCGAPILAEHTKTTKRAEAITEISHAR
jgi:hypothetical protein